MDVVLKSSECQETRSRTDRVLFQSTADGCWETYLEHSLHNTTGVVSDLVIGEGSRTDDALQDASAPVCTGAIPKMVVVSVVEATLLGLHVFLISYASSSSARIEDSLIPSSSATRLRCPLTGQLEEPRLLRSEVAGSGIAVVWAVPWTRCARMYRFRAARNRGRGPRRTQRDRGNP